VVGPLDALGSGFIDRTPPWLKDLAIGLFGTNDKLALRIGMLVVIGVVGAALGVLSLRRPWVGVAGIVAFGVVALLAALERPAEPPAAMLPPLVAIVAGVAALRLLLAAAASWWEETLVPGRTMTQGASSRRRFLRTAGGVVAAAAVAWTAVPLLERRRSEAVDASAPDLLPPVGDQLPSTDSGDLDEVAGITPFVTDNADFYRIDTALRIPTIDSGDWSVRIHGMVDNEMVLSYDQLLARPMVERTVTLCCVSNEVGGDLVGNAVWQGVLLRSLLEEAGVQPGAEQVFSESVDGFTCGFPVEAALDDRDCLIAVGMNGQALPRAHGFPARLVVPGLYGYVSATKWLQRIELTTWEADQGYWIPRGWSREGPIKTQSRIDVPRRDQTVQRGAVTVAGVAWAQQRGIAKVEIRIDGGEWHEARLGDGAGVDAWKQWVYEWDAEPGDHTLQVRATDTTGQPQTEEVAPPAPDGATGYHTRRLTVTA
jgi:DMSO/TMAO reductase YedYZ molybdopterin-dependent catalytic subunit